MTDWDRYKKTPITVNVALEFIGVLELQHARYCQALLSAAQEEIDMLQRQLVERLRQIDELTLREEQRRKKSEETGDKERGDG